MQHKSHRLKRNNFDRLRLLFAGTVCMVHAYQLSGYRALAWIPRVLSSEVVLANLSFLNFLQHTLPGVFEANRLDAVNGALWTLKIEVMFYMTVPFLVFLFRKFSHLPVILLTHTLYSTVPIPDQTHFSGGLSSTL